MDLETFVEQSLNGIAVGIRKANAVHEGGENRGGPFGMLLQAPIDFDVAVCARREGGVEVAGGAGFSVPKVGFFGARAKGHADTAHETVSRIRFTVKLGGTLT